MEITPVLSVIMPCYNQAQYIEEAIESVINQSYRNWELIIIDDGSTDNSFEIAEKYASGDQRIKCLSQPNGGPSKARNNGVKKSVGKYLMFFDSDDKLAPQYFDKGIDYMSSHPNCAVFYSRLKRFGKKNDELTIRFTSYQDHLCSSSLFPTCIIHRTDFERIGGFDEDMKGYEDWEMFIRLLYHNDNVYQYPEIMFFYRWNMDPNSINLQAIKKSGEIMEYIYNKNKQIYDEVFGCPFYSIQKANYLQKELDKIIASCKYRVGSFFANPVKEFKKWYKSLFY